MGQISLATLISSYLLACEYLQNIISSSCNISLLNFPIYPIYVRTGSYLDLNTLQNINKIKILYLNNSYSSSYQQ